MMVISNQAIQLVISEAEADIIQSALNDYTGPYHSSSKLTEFEKQRAISCVAMAEDIASRLREELLCRTRYSPQMQQCGVCHAPLQSGQTWCAACGSNDEDE